MVSTFGNVYAGRRVLLTGHTGFKGGWLALWLRQLGAEVTGLALPAADGLSLFSVVGNDSFQRSCLVELRDADAVRAVVHDAQPEIVFHLAAQPLVGLSYREPIATLSTNAMGTAYLLEALRSERCSAPAVIVTSDKCYRNDNSGRAFEESDPLGGHDVYSMSKAATELVVAAWHASFFAADKALGALATGRAGNVIGGGDYGEDRIVPDAVRAFIAHKPLVLRRPQATRPWQHVLESLSGYLALGQRLLTAPDKATLLNYNFGPDFASERTVQELIDAWLTVWPGGIRPEITPQPTYGEAARLSLNPQKAIDELGWLPVWDFARTVAETASWYRHRHETGATDAAMRDFTWQQINSYTSDARAAGAAWTT